MAGLVSSATPPSQYYHATAIIIVVVDIDIDIDIGDTVDGGPVNVDFFRLDSVRSNVLHARLFLYQTEGFHAVGPRAG